MSDWKKVELGNTWDLKTAKPNDSIEGVYTGKEEHVGDNDSNIYSFEQKDGTVISVWGTTILDTRFKNLKVGEEVKVVYLGEVDSPNRKGKKYHNFEVWHRPVEMEEVS